MPTEKRKSSAPNKSGRGEKTTGNAVPPKGRAAGKTSLSGKGAAAPAKSAKKAAAPAKSAKKAAYTDEAARRAAGKFDRALEARYPEAECSLTYGGDPWRLLVMARLSAQCTDERVNIVCRELFEVFPDAASMASGELSEIERIVRPCGLYRMKASSIREASAIIAGQYAGEIPRDMDSLLALPGVGRKIANLVLGDVYDLGGIVADTHFMRICSRLGFTPAGTKDPVLTERVMDALIPRERQSALCHRAVLFGREVCDARAPHCDRCELSGICTEYNARTSTQE